MRRIGRAYTEKEWRARNRIRVILFVLFSPIALPLIALSSIGNAAESIVTTVDRKLNKVLDAITPRYD